MTDRRRDTASTVLMVLVGVVVVFGLLALLQWGIALLRRLILLVALIAVAVIVVVRKGDR